MQQHNCSTKYSPYSFADNSGGSVGAVAWILDSWDPVALVSNPFSDFLLGSSSLVSNASQPTFAAVLQVRVFLTEHAL